MKRIFKRVFLTFFCITIIFVISATAYISYFDSSVKGNYYFKIAKSLDEQNPKGSGEAVRYYKKAIDAFLGADDKSSAAQAYINLGLLHHKFGNALQVERMVLSALELGRDEIPANMKANIYLLLASTSEPEKAEIYINKSLAISEKMHLHSLTAQSYYFLAVSNEYKAEFEEAEKNYLKAIEAVDNFSNIDTSFDVANLYARLGELYAGGGQTGDAIEYYKKALAYSLREERSFVTANYMKIIGDLYKEKQDYAKACEMWGQSKDEYAFFGAIAPFSNSQNGTNSCPNFG